MEHSHKAPECKVVLCRSKVRSPVSHEAWPNQSLSAWPSSQTSGEDHMGRWGALYAAWNSQEERQNINLTYRHCDRWWPIPGFTRYRVLIGGLPVTLSWGSLLGLCNLTKATQTGFFSRRQAGESNSWLLVLQPSTQLKQIPRQLENLRG